MHKLFVYGSLQSPEIVEKLTGKSFKAKPAVLTGYKRYCVKDCDYPAVIQQNDAETTGFILENVDELSLDIISFYEGDEYEEKTLTAIFGEKEQKVRVFIWKAGIQYLENQEWDFRRFKELFLEYYLETIIPETLKAFKTK